VFEGKRGPADSRRGLSNYGVNMRGTERYELCEMNYAIWNMRNEGGLAKDGASRFG